MTIASYIRPGLGGAQGGLNISEGIRTGDPGLIAGGAYQGLGAYTAASNASVAAGGPAFTGASTVGQWLPFVGMGLSAYNLAINPSQKAAWGTALSGFSAIPGAMPFALGMGVIAGGIGYMRSQSAKHAKHYIQWHTPKLEVVGQDEEGWTYLYDTNFEFHAGGWIGEEESSSAQARRRGFVLRYNPETNELQQTDMSYQSSFSGNHWHHMTPEQATAWIAGEDPGLTSQSYRQLKGSDANIRKGRSACVDSGGRISEQHVAGGANNYYCVTDHAISSEHSKYPQADWKTIDLTHNWDESGKRDPVITDPSAFQAEIYNKVLLPQGYVDAPSEETGWSSVTMNGQEYWMDSSGLMADPESGYLLGAADPESGQVIDFSGDKGRSRIRKSTGEIQSGEIPYLGTIDNWDQISSNFQYSSQPVTSTEPELPEFQPQGTAETPNIPASNIQPSPGLPQFIMPTMGNAGSQGPLFPQNQGVQTMALPPFVTNQQMTPKFGGNLPRGPQGIQPQPAMGGNMMMPGQRLMSGIMGNQGGGGLPGMQQPNRPPMQGNLLQQMGGAQPGGAGATSPQGAPGAAGPGGQAGQQSFLPSFLNIMKMLVQSGQLK